jgi:FMN phosphatase YigB (HAD superfamily)
MSLYQPLEQLVPGLAERMYADQPNPEGWSPFPETIEVMHQLHTAEIPMAVISDIGWDVRPIFAHHTVAHCVSAWVLSFAHGFEKPDPRMFTMGCDVLGVSPADTLMIGDNLMKDGGAIHAGLQALVLPAWSGIGERGLRSALAMAT